MGFSESYYNLGKLYYENLNEKYCISRAIHYLEIAAEQNHPLASMLLGKIYYEGINVKKDYKKAKKYFMKSSLCKNPISLFYLGKMYHEGIGIDRNYTKSNDYFLLASKENHIDSYFYLANHYEKGCGFEKDITKAVEHYLKCAGMQKYQLILNFKEGYKFETYQNEFYYQSNNNLGLIYLLNEKYQNIQKGKEYLKIAAYNEYPYGQNNWGIICQYFLKNLNEANYFYKKASKHFFLAEFNLGRLSELQGDFDKSIEHYSNFLKLNDEKLYFRKQIIDDERLNSSITFIDIYTCLKLCQIFFTENVREDIIQKLIIRTIFHPIIKYLFLPLQESYHFSYQNSNDFSLIDFILQFPLFNLNLKNKSKTNNIWEKYQQENVQSIIIDYKNTINEINQKNDVTKYDEFKEQKYLVELEFIQRNSFENDNFKEEIENIFNEINTKQMQTSKIINIIQTKKNYKICFICENGIKEKYIQFPKNLIPNICRDKEALKNEINKSIQEIDKILFSFPYSILFGRIPFYTTMNLSKNDINQTFYKGFDLQI